MTAGSSSRSADPHTSTDHMRRAMATYRHGISIDCRRFVGPGAGVGWFGRRDVRLGEALLSFSHPTA